MLIYKHDEDPYLLTDGWEEIFDTLATVAEHNTVASRFIRQPPIQPHWACRSGAYFNDTTVIAY